MVVPLMPPQVRIAQLQKEVGFLRKMSLESEDSGAKSLYSRLISLLTDRIEVLKKASLDTKTNPGE